MTYIYNNIMSVSTAGGTTTLVFTHQDAFLRNIEFTPTVGASVVDRSGAFTKPTISVGDEPFTIRLDFSNRRSDRFDKKDWITILFDRPVTPGVAHFAGFPDGSSIKLNPCAIPEPGGVMLGSIGLFLLLMRGVKAKAINKKTGEPGIGVHYLETAHLIIK